MSTFNIKQNNMECAKISIYSIAAAVNVDDEANRFSWIYYSGEFLAMTLFVIHSDGSVIIIIYL